MSTSTLAPRRSPLVLTDALPRVRALDAVLVVAGAGLTAVGAQIAIDVPPSPVPITGQTLAVVLAAGALGARRGALSQLLYLALGLLLPIYSEGTSGWHVLSGATGGYIVGFVIAAWIVGRLAEHGADRRPAVAFATFALGQLAIFGVGVPWLKASTGMDWGTAIHEGFSIFVVGGIVKALIAAGVTPAAWRMVRRAEGRGR
jgi:biotin transport system substrate-specific component